MKPTATRPSPGTLKQLPIAEIVISPGRMRSLHPVDDLQESIASVGLLTPIVVTDEKRLVAGLHRVHACKALGWRVIPAMVLPLSAVDAELAEIDENLCRTELTVLERGEHLARRKVLYEARHPQAKHGAAKGKSGGGKVARAKTK